MKLEPAFPEGVSARRRLGAYYTPDAVAGLLVRWSLPEPGSILDPSFGGCSFLRASLARLNEFGAQQPGDYVFGIDIDKAALDFARELMQVGLPQANVTIDDFFRIDPATFHHERFDAVVGNPPYIRHHWLDADVLMRAASAARAAGFLPSGRSAAWLYFVVHSTRFLAQGGRLALLLPCSALDADYASPLIAFLRERFASSSLIRLRERLFHDAEEVSVLLLCEDFGAGPGVVQFGDIDSITELEATLDESHTRLISLPESYEQDWRVRTLSVEAQGVWRKAAVLPNVARLATLADITIGVVTGANEFFIRSRGEVDPMDSTMQSVSIVPRSRWLKTLTWSKADQASKERLGSPSRLVLIGDPLPESDAAREVLSGENALIDKRFKCRNREPWYLVPDIHAPDAFLPYMGAASPTIVLNQARATCTNAVHRLWWRNSLGSTRAAAVGSWTALFALSTEIYGRSYGGGVLKLEPSAAKRCLLPATSISSSTAADIDRLARSGESQSARDLADRLILVEQLGFQPREVQALRDGVRLLSERRTGRC